VFEALFVENFVITSSVLVRRDCLDVVGYFNPRYLNAQDYDLWLRLALRYRFLYVPEVLVRYWSVAQSLSKNFDRLYAMDFEISGRIMKENPELFRARRDIVRTRFGSLHFRYGWRLFENRRLQEARREFGASLKFRPVDFRTYGYWVATFLPEHFVAAIRRFRRARAVQAQ
jgi:GT2 family glycosyltransferase